MGVPPSCTAACLLFAPSLPATVCSACVPCPSVCCPLLVLAPPGRLYEPVTASALCAHVRSTIMCSTHAACRDRPQRPLRCLEGQYRRELVRVYLSNVEGIARRFVEEKREALQVGAACRDPRMRHYVGWLGCMAVPAAASLSLPSSRVMVQLALPLSPLARLPGCVAANAGGGARLQAVLAAAPAVASAPAQLRVCAAGTQGALSCRPQQEAARFICCAAERLPAASPGHACVRQASALRTGTGRTRLFLGSMQSLPAGHRPVAGLASS